MQNFATSCVETCDSAHRVLKRQSGKGRKRKRDKGGKKSSRVKKRKDMKRSFHNAFIRDVGTVAEALSVSSEFDMFAQKPVQTSVQEAIETIYRPIASVDQRDLETLIPAEHDT